MGVQKGFRNDIKIQPQKTGIERRLEILDGIRDNSTFLPKPVLEEDLDSGFVNFVNTDLSITINGEKVPVIFLTLQRWNEFTKTWKFTDKHKDIKIPFITVVRQPDIQPGQNQAGLWNIPGNRTYTYIKVPTKDDSGRIGIDLYKIPQPTSVDVTYEVRIFSTKINELNKFSRIIQKTFQSRQYYINIKGHPMPIHLESNGDESNIDNLDDRKFYVQIYEMKLLGYILDSDDFEVVPTINRTLTLTELDNSLKKNTTIFQNETTNNILTSTFIFQKDDSIFSYTSTDNIIFTQLTDIENITRIIIYINNIGVFDGLVLTSPLDISVNDIVSIRVYKSNLVVGKFKLIAIL